MKDDKETIDNYLSEDRNRLSHQQQRFCDLYLTHFNAFKAAVESGYSENTSRKGALLHVPKIQRYLKEAMTRRSQRLEITHDMILRELSKIAFANMGNYYDEDAMIKPMNKLTVDEKAAIAYYEVYDHQDADGNYLGTQSKIKLHNKMAALDRIARHLNFYGTVQKPVFEREAFFKQEVGSMKREAFLEEEEKREMVVVDRSTNNLPMDYPAAEGVAELEGLDEATLMAVEDIDIGPGRPHVDVEDEVSGFDEGAKNKEQGREDEGSPESGVESLEPGSIGEERGTEGIEKFLTISPLRESQKLKFKSQNDWQGGDLVREFERSVCA